MPFVATLSESDLDFGRRVTEQLKTAKFPFSGTFWLYDEEADDWRFVIVTDLVDKEGPRSTYLRLGSTIADVSKSHFQSLRITALSPQTPIYAGLRKIFKDNAEETRIQNTMVDGQHIQNAYLYEVR